APVHHMVVQEHFDDLVVGTYGRGFWILDDITPLQQLTPKVTESDVFLFDPRPAYRFHDVTGGADGDATAHINYYLKSSPEGEVEISIVDKDGVTVNTLEGTKKAGINRAPWNLRYEPAKGAKLRIKPTGNPHVVEEKRFRKTWEDEGWYPVESWGTGGGFAGIRVRPGTYSVKLTVDGEDHSTELVVRKDPRSAGSLADIDQLVSMQLKLRDDINAVADLVNRMEWLRKQLQDLRDVLADEETAELVLNAADEFEAKISALEDQVLQPMNREADSKSFRFPNLLYAKLSVLAGDVAENVDFTPNEQQREVHALLRESLEKHTKELDELVETELSAFNALLLDLGFSGVVAPQPVS
ncbi:MAG: sialidase, partial [bacterium]|nr:sialidase [bacterium]